MNGFVRRLARPLDRGQYSKVVLFSVWCAMMTVSSSNDGFPAFHWLMMIMAGLYVLIWPSATAGRLADIGWSRWWVVAFAMPWVLFICIADWGGKLWTLAALFVVILAHLPLLLIKGGGLRGASLGIRAPAEPRA
jgi:uncharacterized membrane protein YhaH (DUF805 family)